MRPLFIILITTMLLCSMPACKKSSKPAPANAPAVYSGPDYASHLMGIRNWHVHYYAHYKTEVSRDSFIYSDEEVELPDESFAVTVVDGGNITVGTFHLGYMFTDSVNGIWYFGPSYYGRDGLELKYFYNTDQMIYKYGLISNHYTNSTVYSTY